MAYACCYAAGGIDKIEEEILKSIEEEEEAYKDEKWTYLHSRPHRKVTGAIPTNN